MHAGKPEAMFRMMYER